MGYTRTYSTVISGSVGYTYGKSEHGGSGTAHWSETVIVNIHVDDDLFQSNINACNSSIIAVGTEVNEGGRLQLEEKRAGAEKISNSLLSGFVGYTKNLFSSRMIELENNCHALLPRIDSYQNQLRAIKDRMANDYNIIKSRYITYFETLNNNLQRQMNQLYGPCFTLIEDFLKEKSISPMQESLTKALAYNHYTNETRTLLETIYLKKELNGIICYLSNVLEISKRTERQFIKFLSENKEKGTFYVPVFYVETEDVTTDKKIGNCYYPDFFDEKALGLEEILKTKMQDVGQKCKEKEEDRIMLKEAFLSILSKETDKRKSNIILQLFNDFQKGEKDE